MIKGLWERIKYRVFLLKISIQRLRGWPRSLVREEDAYSEGERRELIKSLLHHPGFQLLVMDLESNKAYFERTRQGAKPKNSNGELFARQIVELDAHIFWTGWLQYKVRAAGVEVPLPPPIESEEL